MGRKRLGWIAFALAAAVIVIGILRGPHALKTPILRSTTTAQASTSEATTPAVVASPTPLPDYLSIVREVVGPTAATQPLNLPLPLGECARFALPEPITLDAAGEMWITRPDALPLAEVLKSASTQPTHIVQETVLFVHRQPKDDQWSLQLVCRKPDGSVELIDGERRVPLLVGKGAQWDRAIEWNTSEVQGFIVPTDDGVSVIRPAATPIESNLSLGTSHALKPIVLLDARGLLAWTDDSVGRFVDGHWHRFTAEDGWPKKLLQLVPLLDGTVFQIFQQDDGNVAVHAAHLDVIPIDAKTVQPFIDQLSDPDPQVRDAASAALSRYGPGLWPILEKELPDQSPEGVARIQNLLRDHDHPAINGMTLLPGPAQVLARCVDGTAILHLTAGVSVAPRDADQSTNIVAPADLLFAPGQPVRLANALLTHDLRPDATIQRSQDEWLVSDAAEGTRRFMENHFEPLLRPHEQMYSQLIGIDRQGRWLFRRPLAAQPTFVLDPTLPDNTPKLAAWIDPFKADRVGRDQQGWPIFVRGKNVCALHDTEWTFHAVEQHDDKPPTTRSETTLLSDSDGTTYSGGMSDLIVHHPDGRLTNWPLPPEAVGSGRPWLVRAADGKLFLFNQAGRVVRLSQANASQIGPPFTIDAIFTRQIPNAAVLQRVWVDPAGRIDLIYDNSHLTILFPDGRILPEIEQMMPNEQVNADRSP